VGVVVLVGVGVAVSIPSANTSKAVAGLDAVFVGASPLTVGETSADETKDSRTTSTQAQTNRLGIGTSPFYLEGRQERHPRCRGAGVSVACMAAMTGQVAATV
jgi:hypothetical protein